jgi:hypothetical protein
MKDVSSLQIDPRCFKCGRFSNKELLLYEMRNHLFICSTCRQEAEGHGKQIAWVDTAPPKTPTTETLGLGKSRVLTSSLPPDSLFASLKLSLDTPIEEIASAIKKKMKEAMKISNTQERTKMSEQLQDWQEKLEEVDAFEAYRASLKPQRKGNALSVGGRAVLSAEAFVAACEDSKEGWADGERYLRKGHLKQWVLYQLQDKELASNIGQDQAWLEVSDFRALNQALYRLNPDRPFRFYQSEQWQQLDKVVSSSTPQDLATTCDLYWDRGEKHLYEGSMVFWLEHCQKLQDITTYYRDAIAMYASDRQNRGVGLELLLERAVPTLTKPNLRVTFDDTENSYTLTKWDRELQHQPVTVAITNTTRGFTSIRLKTDQKTTDLEPDWLSLTPRDPFLASGRLGDNKSATAKINLQNLSYLRRGKKYQRTLTMSILGEQGKIASLQTFPITIRTMSFFQGLRGRLWQWGLRGDFPGLFWNGIVAAIISFVLLNILPGFVPTTWEPDLTLSGQQIGPFLQTSVLMGKALLISLYYTFVLANIIIIGIAGFMVGINKGHADYDARTGARHFRTWTTWLSLILIVSRSFWTKDADLIDTLFKQNNPASNTEAILSIASYILIWLLLFFTAQITAIIRIYLEKFLRSHFAELLDLPGRG